MVLHFPTHVIGRGLEGHMAQQRPTTHRLASFSDGVFAVIITIMVLELKPPEHPTFPTHACN
jgi:uncharacterized membrane protein